MYTYELGTTEKTSKEWADIEFGQNNAGWLEGSTILIYRDDYDSVAEAWKSGGTYEIFCTSGSDVTIALEAVRVTAQASGHHVCVALKTQNPI